VTADKRRVTEHVQTHFTDDAAVVVAVHVISSDVFCAGRVRHSLTLIVADFVSK